jgi:hypothetical protein
MCFMSENQGMLVFQLLDGCLFIRNDFTRKDEGP